MHSYHSNDYFLQPILTTEYVSLEFLSFIKASTTSLESRYLEIVTSLFYLFEQ